MPSTSGRAATYPKRADKLKFFYELKDLRDKLKAQKHANPAAPVAGTPKQADVPNDIETPEQVGPPKQVETPVQVETPTQDEIPSTELQREE